MLLQRAKTQSERFIINRRMQDDSINKLASKLKQESHERAFANWEIKGQTVEKKKFYNQRLSNLRELAQQQIDQRRDNLNFLLKNETEQYKKEIQDLEETPEQVRARMLNRVKELKQQKEENRKKFVEEQYERRFEDEADELRKVDADFKELKTMQERNLQMMEKQKNMVENFEEEMIYADLYKREIKRKEKEELEKLKAQQIKVDERNKILAFQKNLLEEKNKQEKNLDKSEKQMLNKEWKNEEERVKKQNEEQFKFNRQLNKNMIMANFEEKRIKEVEKQLEKNKDKKWIEEVIHREKALDKLDHEIIERQKKETRDFLLNFRNRANELNTNEQELNKLIDEENENQWKKRMDVWQKEEDQRVKLLYEVYDSRAQDLDYKKTVQNQEKNEKDKEKQTLITDLENFTKEEERTREELWKKNKMHQKEIINQKFEKIDRRALTEQEKQREIEEERRQEEEYKKKLEARKLKGKELLDELRKMRPY